MARVTRDAEVGQSATHDADHHWCRVHLPPRVSGQALVGTFQGPYVRTYVRSTYVSPTHAFGATPTGKARR